MAREKVLIIHAGPETYIRRYWQDVLDAEEIPLISYFFDDIETNVRLMTMCDSVRICTVACVIEPQDIELLRRIARGLSKPIEEVLYTQEDFL
jgi:hypothetical protein